jgi:hypothetical protein
MSVDDEHGAITMGNERTTVRSDDLYDVRRIVAADHRQLHRFVLVFGQEAGDATAGGHGIDTDVRVEPRRLLDPTVQFVVGDFAEVLLPHTDRENRRISQSCLVQCVLDDRFVVGLALYGNDDPVGAERRRGVR